MSNDELATEGVHLNRWEHHRFILLVAATIAISLFLVGVSLAMYATSGTAQLDLSRPGYTSVRNQATHSDSFKGFSEDGPINKESLDQFRSLYDKQAEQATGIDSFGGAAMSDQTLSIDAPSDTNAAQ